MSRRIQIGVRSHIEMLEGRTLLSAVLCAADSQGLLYTVDTGSGATHAIGYMGTVMADIAFSPQGQLYGVDNSSNASLYAINSTTAAITQIGPLGTYVSSLAFSPNGTLYGAQISLNTINLSTGAASAVGVLGGYTSAGDLAFDNAGRLFMSATSGDLVAVDPSNAAASAVGPTGLAQLLGLAFGSDGVLYGLDNQSNQVIAVDLASGHGTPVSTMAGVQGAFGADVVPSALLPQAPAEVTASKGTFANHVHITWSPAAGAQSYEVWRNSVDDFASATAFPIDIVNTSYDDAVQPGNTYYYWVTARNPIAMSAPGGSSSGFASVIAGSFVNSDPLRHIFPNYRTSEAISITNNGTSPLDGVATVDFYLSSMPQVTSELKPLLHIAHQPLSLAMGESVEIATKGAQQITIPKTTEAGTYYVIARVQSAAFANPIDVVSPQLSVGSPFGSTKTAGDTATARAKRYVADALFAKAHPVTPDSVFTDEAAEKFIADNEGSLDWAYRDQNKIPSIGVGLALQYRDAKGNLVDSPSAEALITQLGLPYTFDEIVQQSYTNTRKKHVDVLSDSQITTLMAGTYSTAKTNAQAAVSNFGALNVNTQIALVDMSFNLGAGHLAAFTEMLSDLNNNDPLSAAFDSMNSLRASQIPPRAKADLLMLVEGQEGLL